MNSQVAFGQPGKNWEGFLVLLPPLERIIVTYNNISAAATGLGFNQFSKTVELTVPVPVGEVSAEASSAGDGFGVISLGRLGSDMINN